MSLSIQTIIFTSILFTFGQVLASEPSLDRLRNTNSEALYDIPSEENIENARRRIQEKKLSPLNTLLSLESKKMTLEKYNHLDPEKLIPTNLLEKVLLYFDANKQAFENQNIITVVDFSMRSNFSRMFIVDMQSGYTWAVHTTHGKGGDRDHDGFVEVLSNISRSKQSSKGFFMVSEIYSGRYGRSIRLDGLTSTNSNVRRRAIVIHGSDWVKEQNIIQGRSWGCFALAWSIKDQVVDKIYGGSLLYADKSQN